MANKITKRMVINSMLEEETIVSNEIYKNYLEHELELLDKKSNSKSLSKTQVANIEVKENLINAMRGLEPMTATNAGTLVGISCSKASALLHQLEAENKIVVTKDKKITLFSVVE